MAKAMTYDGVKLKVVDYKEDAYDFLKNAVDGYIERVVIREFEDRDIDMWINEEGKFRGFDTTIYLNYQGKIYDYIVGNVVFTRKKDGETIGLKDEDIEFIRNKFHNDGFYIDLKNDKIIQVLNY